MRHAKSDWSVPGRKDFDRPLNDRGKESAPLMGKFLDQTSNTPDLILASTARRVVQTIEGASSSWSRKPDITYLDKIYGGSANTYLEVLQSYGGNAETVMITGHNPTMEETAAIISIGTNGQILRFPTAAIACFEMPDISWKSMGSQSGTLKWFVTPKLLSKI